MATNQGPFNRPPVVLNNQPAPAIRPPMPVANFNNQLPRPPMPPRPVMNNQLPRPPMVPPMVQSQGMNNQLPRPPMPPRPGFNNQLPRPPMVPPMVQSQGMNNQLPRPPMPPRPGFNNHPSNFGNMGFNQMNPQAIQPGMVQIVSEDENLYNNMERVDSINYGDAQYIKDLEALQNFYEENAYTPILSKRYQDFDLEWKAPHITLPIEELYARLKYYDNLMTYEKLSELQMFEVKQNIDEIINQINMHDDYNFYKENGYEKLYYNDQYVDEYYKSVNFYQRDSDIKTWGDNINYVPISMKKDKWWIAQEVSIWDDEYDSAFVNVINGQNYPNDIFSHPMFKYLDEYGSSLDLNNDRILCEVPEQETYIRYQNPNQEPQVTTVNEVKKNKKKHWWNFSKDKNNGKENKTMQNKNVNQTTSPGFPKKENPTPPQAPNFPTRQNPTPPQAPNFPTKQNPTPPKPGFGPNPTQQLNNQAYFSYQQK